jgi:MoaA/NifB/PqqE/SkfB family radical SAM enzyme
MQAEKQKESGGTSEPILISLRPTLRCNFKCTFCLSDSGPHRKEYAARDELIAFFDQLDKAQFRGAMHICGGEPFLYKDINWLIAESCKHAEEVTVLTNGSWIPYTAKWRGFCKLKDELRMLKELPNVKIRISLDSYHLQEHTGDPRGIKRLMTFARASKAAGLTPGEQYIVQVTEATHDEAENTKRKIERALGMSGDDASFIRTREMYKLGRSEQGREFRIGEQDYIIVNPTLEGRLIIYAGRAEECEQSPYGGIETLGALLDERRAALGRLMRKEV